MLSTFYQDLEKAKTAEDLVLKVFDGLTDEYRFEAVGSIREYFHKGDIKATDIDGNEHFIEVKDDSCIGKTHNVLCEEDIFYQSIGEFVKGNMYSDYEIYCVVSQSTRKIYVIDFKVLKRIYHKGQFKEIPHREQTTYCYLVPLAMIRKEGGMIAEIDY